MPIQFKEFPVELPSQGVAYNDDKVQLIEGDKVKIRPFMAGDLRHMANSKDPYEFFTSLLHQIVREPKGLSFDNFLVSDAVYLIFMSRMEGVGRSYTPKYRCQNCAASSIQEISLEALEVLTPEDLNGSFKANDNEVNIAGCKLIYHLPRLFDEKQTAIWLNTLRNKKKVLNADFDREYVMIAQLIDTVDGAPQTVEQKFELVQQFSVDDFRFLSRRIGENDTGIRTKTTITCGACNVDNDVFISLNPEFFRSNANREE